MNLKMKVLRPLAAALLVVGIVAVYLAADAPSNAPSIQGSYVLESRDTPDGKQVRPPEVMGMMTFTKDRRNFNVYWTQGGKPASISLISKYTLSDTEISEESTYFMMNDGSGPKYETTPSSGKSPVTMKDGKLSFKLPTHDEPAVVFDKDGFTATRAGEFVDHWKKID